MEFYCHHFFVKIPWKYILTKELYSKLIWRKKFAWQEILQFLLFPQFAVRRNDGNLLLHIFDKNSVKVTCFFKDDFTEKISVRENVAFFPTRKPLQVHRYIIFQASQHFWINNNNNEKIICCECMIFVSHRFDFFPTFSF